MGQDDLMRARLSPRYRHGIWLGRLGNALGLPLVAWALIGSPPPFVFLIGWSLTMALLAAALWRVLGALPKMRRASAHGARICRESGASATMPMSAPRRSHPVRTVSDHDWCGRESR